MLEQGSHPKPDWIRLDDATIYQWQIVPTRKWKGVFDALTWSLTQDDSELESYRSPLTRRLVQIVLIPLALLMHVFVTLPLFVAIFHLPYCLFMLIHWAFGEPAAAVTCVATLVLLLLASRKHLIRRLSGNESASVKFGTAAMLAASLGVLAYVIRQTPSFLPVGFVGTTTSSGQWMLFFVDTSLNAIYFSIPVRLFGHMTDIAAATWQTNALVWIYQATLVYGVARLVLLLVGSNLQLVWRGPQLYYGTVEDLFYHLRDHYLGLQDLITIRRLGTLALSLTPEETSCVTLMNYITASDSAGQQQERNPSAR